ncbi:hypothetical protein B9Z55_012165 [Caenorhabditis nigoni]|uniref:Peptidase S1 domain-containing protein n=1 Tax=Caenorhabditis nigoni TaxID=1611254 RepID=A0A2G5TW34_9PELO|nr:hypothetical protein B9Z55_012165 [Caenorhabditis nigoni]
MMKLQSIILVLICGVVYQASCLKLNDLENEKRLNFCGGRFLPQPSQNARGVNVNLDETWLVSVEQVQTKLDHTLSVGFPISQRHILTSSQVVITGSQQWALDGTTFHVNCTNYHAEVPANTIDNLFITMAQQEFRVARGRIFFACKTEHPHKMFHAMLLELSMPINMNDSYIPCLADDITNAPVGSIVHSYGFDHRKLKHHRVKIGSFKQENGETGVIPRWVYTNKYKVELDRGGPLIYNSSGKAVVVGIKASSPHDEGASGVYFNNMIRIQHDICDYSGVCPPIIPTTTTTTTPTTTVPPPTTSPLTQNTDILESSTISNSLISPRIPPNPNSNLTDYVETDFEESEKDFKVEVEYVDELDERELEVYFERDKFNGSGGIKMDVNLFLIFMIWRVF